MHASINKLNDLIVVGGGPAGVFAAIWAKTVHPQSSVLILEKSSNLLAKVRISGGGRCNLTNAHLNSKTASRFYPRGSQELIGPLTRWSSSDTIEWFISKGVSLKTEEEGRVFPASDQSQTIVNCLLSQLDSLKIETRFGCEIQTINKEKDLFSLKVNEGETLYCRKLILATGSSKEGYRWAEELGHTIVPPIPSLFTFNISSFTLKELSGITVNPVELRIDGTTHIEKGSLMIAHFGFSGPAVLKLSAFQARYLHDQNIQADLIVNWLPEHSEKEIHDILCQIKTDVPQQNLISNNPFSLPKSLWKVFLNDQIEKRLRDLSLKELRALASRLHSDRYRIGGKTAHKEEFVTCGGVERREINFKTMESKINSNLFFAGELIDIDGITGGFNLQNGWTTGFLAGMNSLNN